MAESLFAREVYGKTLIELGKINPDIVVLDADLSNSTKTGLFRREFPTRFFNFGVAEQNMMAAAAGFSSCGKIVFASTFAVFAAGRAWDQVRNTIGVNNFNVKIVATHAGVTVGPDGASHQAVEDVALMRVIPTMHIIVPCDGPETKEAVLAASSEPGPFYIRLGRMKVDTIENKKAFCFGKGYTLTEGDSVSIVACGAMVKEALKADEALRKEGIMPRVINIHTIKPIDKDILLKAAQETKGIVVCEEHSIYGGLGSAVEDVLASLGNIRIIKVGIKDRFGQSGEPADLMKEYGLTADDIVKAVKCVIF